MANTFTNLNYHIIFSTRKRERLVMPAIEERVWSYLGGIAASMDAEPMRIGGVEDHIHLLLRIPAKHSVSKVVQTLKGSSSHWMNEEVMEHGHFAWQDGYAAFTVSKSSIAQVSEYIAGQREHHQTKDFKAEYISFLERHGVEYDERYLFD
jgi:putative transposase